MKLGIIGAENSHTAAIAAMLNIQKAIKGFSVTHVWGETDEFARKAAETGKIPNIVKEPSDMIGQVDCVMIDHRDGKNHLAPAEAFLKAGVPIFIDKPLSTDLAKAKAFLSRCQRRGVPVTTMSAVPHQACITEIRKAIKEVGPVKAVHINGPGDYRSPYGGIWFYGIHQVDLMVELLGANPKTATLLASGDDSTAVVGYADGVTVTMSFVKSGLKSFSLSLVGENGSSNHKIVMDGSPYLATTKKFTFMFRTGREPFTRQRMLAPLAVLEAMAKSLLEHKTVKVSPV